jgi:hypothetical protein
MKSPPTDPASPTRKYVTVRDEMQDGDVIAFGGKGRMSALIKWKTCSPYSHVGMVLHLEDMGLGFGESIVIIESTTTTDLPDIIHRTVIKGVQMQWLSKRLASYDGSVWWVPLDVPIEKDGKKRMRSWLRQKHNKRTPYDMAQAIGAGMDLWDSLGFENEPDFDKLFCSELCARAFQEGGVVPVGFNASEQTPENVVSGLYQRRGETVRAIGMKAPVLLKA